MEVCFGWVITFANPECDSADAFPRRLLPHDRACRLCVMADYKKNMVVKWLYNTAYCQTYLTSGILLHNFRSPANIHLKQCKWTRFGSLHSPHKSINIRFLFADSVYFGSVNVTTAVNAIMWLTFFVVYRQSNFEIWFCVVKNLKQQPINNHSNYMMKMILIVTFL